MCSHTVNLLGNLPLKCLDVLLLPKVQPGSLEYMGVNMDAVNVLLDFLDRRLDRVGEKNGLSQLLITPLPLLLLRCWTALDINPCAWII